MTIGRRTVSGALPHMLREIREAPQAATLLLEREGPGIRAIGARLRRRNPVAVLIAARGSSDNAAVYGKYVLESRLGVPIALAAPSVVTLLDGRLHLRRAVAIGISQSGQSTDVVAFLAAARAGGALTLAITNAARSPLARAAHETVLTHAGNERSVAATKTYLNQLIAMALLGAAWAGDQGLGREVTAIPEAQRAVSCAISASATSRDSNLRTSATPSSTRPSRNDPRRPRNGHGLLRGGPGRPIVNPGQVAFSPRVKPRSEKRCSRIDSGTRTVGIRTNR